jgi:hypothetical protein
LREKLLSTAWLTNSVGSSTNGFYRLALPIEL